MNSWLTEQDLRDSREDVKTWPGLTLNVAFLNDIKQDTEKPDELIGELKRLLMRSEFGEPSRLVFLLSRLRDELETYFALEEFYGYFDSAKTSHSRISLQAEGLQSQHETIYLEVCELVEMAESALYREKPIEQSWPAIVAGFHSFVQNFHSHEQQEQELMMQLCNDDLGVSG